MKKITAILLVMIFCATAAFAQAGKPATGNDWIKVGRKAHVQLVNDFITQMKTEGVTISKGAEFYCDRLDRLYVKKPKLIPEPVWKVLKTSMIMEYDWKVKGRDSDAIAKEWLDEKTYKKNKERRAAQR